MNANKAIHPAHCRCRHCQPVHPRTRRGGMGRFLLGSLLLTIALQVLV